MTGGVPWCVTRGVARGVTGVLLGVWLDGVAGVCGLGCVAGVCDQGCGQGHTFYLEGFGNLGSTKIVNSRTFLENKVKLGTFFLGGGIVKFHKNT